MVETWQWTPLVMLIVLGGIASLPSDPYEAAILDGASAWQMFRHITLPLVWPFIMVAAVIRTDRRAEGIRHHLRDHRRRAGHVQRDHQHPAVSDRIRLLRPGLRLGDGRGVLRADHADQPGAAARPPAGGPGDEAGHRARARLRCGRAGLYVSVLLLVSPAILFFLWMLSLSLKNEVDNTAYPPVFIPNPPTLANFVDVFEKNDFLTYTINSVIVSFSRDRAGAAVRRAGGLRHRQDEGHQGRGADPDRARHAGPVLPDPAVPAVPVARA